MAPTQSQPVCAGADYSATGRHENEAPPDHHSSPHSMLFSFHHLTLAPPTPRFAAVDDPSDVPRDLTRCLTLYLSTSYDLTEGWNFAIATADSPHLQVSQTVPNNRLTAVRHFPTSVPKTRSLRVKKKVMRERTASKSPKTAFEIYGTTSRNGQPFQRLKWMQPFTASMMEAKLEVDVVPCAAPSQSGKAEELNGRHCKPESKADLGQTCLFQSHFSDYESSLCSSDSSGGNLW
ncbi:hypothetical protein BKA63DRAFT_558905 [Paraphoma chrysanthemicola]|nr:hypothetical protein BKA63DRAFT_558905 [Paraphoma chrysanthemicola]